MQVKDLMRTRVLTVRETDPVEDVVDILVREHIHGAPVVDESGRLVGVVSQLDIYFGTMTRARESESDAGGEQQGKLRVEEIMTAPAVSADEEMDIKDLCRMMYRLRLHRVPIVAQGKITGIVSSLDICNAVARGEAL